MGMGAATGMKGPAQPAPGAGISICGIPCGRPAIPIIGISIEGAAGIMDGGCGGKPCPK